MARKTRFDKLLGRLRDRDIDQTDVNITGGSISGVSIVDHMTTATDPALNAAVTTAIIDEYNGVVVTLTGAGNNQTLQNPTTATNIKKFLVTNNDTSTHDLSVIANSDTYTLGAGESQMFIWDGSKWFPTNIPITDVPVKVSEGGTGVNTLTDHGVLVGSGTDAITPLAVLGIGEVLKGNTGADPSALAGNTTTTKKFLTETGTGAAAQDPAWNTIISGDLTTALTTPPAIGGTTPAAGAFTTLSATGDIEAAATGTPKVVFKDSDCADADDNAEIYAEATDTGSGTEDIDLYFRQQINGTMSTFLHADADGDLDFSNRNIKTTGALKDNTYTTYVKDIRSSVSKQSSLSSDTTLTDIVPAGYCLEYIVFEEKDGNTATLDLGTSAGGNEVFINQAVTASSITTVSINTVFSLSAATTLYLNDDDAGSSWNSGRVDAYFVMRRII